MRLEPNISAKACMRKNGKKILDDLLITWRNKRVHKWHNHKGPEKPLIGVERKTDQGWKGQRLSLVLLTLMCIPKEKILLKSIEQTISSAKSHELMEDLHGIDKGPKTLSLGNCIHPKPWDHIPKSHRFKAKGTQGGPLTDQHCLNDRVASKKS